MAEEEVHGGVEVRFQPDEQDDEQVPQHHGQVHAQDQGKEHALLLWPYGELQEEEIGNMALVLPPHAGASVRGDYWRKLNGKGGMAWDRKMISIP